MTADRHSQAFLGFVWLALATILANALAPTGSALETSSGSAFNPFTSEVSLGPSRASVAPKAKSVLGAARDGKAGSGPSRIDAPVIAAASTPVLAPPQPDAAADGPILLPARSTVARGFQARAPPFALS